MKNKLLLSDTVLVIDFRHDFTHRSSDFFINFFKKGYSVCMLNPFFYSHDHRL